MNDIWEDEDFVKEMDRRIKEMESGTVKTYTWEEVKEITRKALSEIRLNKDPEHNKIIPALSDT